MSNSVYDKILNKAVNSNSATAMKLAEQRVASQEKAKELFNIQHNPQEVDHFGMTVAPEVGQASAGQLEKDTARLYPSELYGEYGDDITSELTTGAVNAQNEYTAGRLATPDLETRLADGVVNTGGAFLQDFADTLHLGGMALTGLTGNTVPIDKATGWVANTLEDKLEDMQSPYSKARSKEYQAELARKKRDNSQKIYNSPLDRVIDDVQSTLGVLANNPEEIIKSVESGVGSLLSGYATGNVLASQIAKQSGKQARKKAEKAVVKDLEHNGLTPKDIPDFEKKVTDLAKDLSKAKTPLEEMTVINKLKEYAPYVLTNTASELGNIGRGAYNEVDQMSEEQLLKGSKEYRDRRAAGETHEEAKRNVALIASQVAASQAFPLILTANLAVGKIESAPFSLPKSLPGTMSLQAGEEMLEEGIGTASSNFAIKKYANENKDVLEDVGSDMAVGLVAGAGTAGAVKAPSVALNTAGKAIKGVANKANQKSTERNTKQDSVQYEKHIEPKIAEVKEEISKVLDTPSKPPKPDEPPVGNEVYSSDELSAQSENKDLIINNVDSVITPKISKDDLTANGLSEEVATRISQNTDSDQNNIIDQAGHLLKELQDPNNSEEDKLAIAGTIAQLNTNLKELFNLADFGSEDIRTAINDKLEPLIQSIQETSTIVGAMESVSEYYASLQINENIANESPDDVMLHHYVNKMELAPETVTSEQAESIIRHAENSENISEARKARLQSTLGIIKAAEDAIKKDKGRSDLTKEDLVSLNIVNEDNTETGKLSAKTHIDEVYKDMEKGNTEGAKENLNQLRNIAAHMLFKLDALSKSIKSKKKHKHYAVTPTGEWYRGTKEYGVSNNPKSISFAKGVETEANFLIDVYNQTAKTFPELGMKPLHNMRLGQVLPKEYIKGILNTVPKQESKKVDHISQLLEENSEIQDSNPLPNVEEKVDTPTIKVEPIAKVSPELKKEGIISKKASTNNDTDSINIYAGTNENVNLSNFAQRPFTVKVNIEGKKMPTSFDSVEQGFHYYKAKMAGRMDIAKEVLNTTNGAKLRALTNKNNLNMNPEQLKSWDNSSRGIMKSLMKASFKQNPLAREELLATNDAEITHHKNGVEQDNGRFSEVLTEVRKELRNTITPSNIDSNSIIKPTTEIKTDTSSRKDDNLSISEDAIKAQQEEYADRLARKKETKPEVKEEPTISEQDQLPLDFDTVLDETINEVSKDKTEKVSNNLQEVYDKVIEGKLSKKDLESLNESEIKQLDNMLARTKSISKIYPDLLGSDKNISSKNGNGLFRAFDVSVRSNSSFAFIKKPIAILTKVLGTVHDKYAQKFKKNNKYSIVANEYKNFVNEVTPLLKAKLIERLNSSDYLIKGIKEGKGMYRSSKGQMLNIAKMNEDGSLTYDDHFIELAILAGLQSYISPQPNFTLDSMWEVLWDNGISLGSIEDKDLRKTLNNLTGGSTTEHAKKELARKISEYWGLRSNEDSPEGLRLGIPEAIAAEIITSMMDVEYNGKPMVTRSVFALPSIENDNVTKNIAIYNYAELPENDVKYIHDDVIDTNVLKKPESTFYIGNEIPPTAKTVVRSSVPLSKDTQKAVEASNKVKYTPNEAFYDFAKSIGEEALNDFIFPETAGDIKDFNIVSAQSARSKRDILNKAFKDFEKLQKKAKDMGEDLVVRFNHFIASEGRIHQSHPGVQSNKTLRELLSPTNDTLDLTDEHVMKVYTTALAQGFGVNVSYQTYEKTVKDFNDIIDYLSPEIEAISDWLNGDGSVDLKEVLANIARSGKIDNTMVAIHNLFDYVRMTNSEDISKFNSNVYLELDGITSGSTLANLLFGTDLTNDTFIDILGRGGILLDKPEDSSYNERREAGEFSDNYIALSEALTENSVITLGEKNGFKGYSVITKAFLKVFPNMVKLDSDGKEVTSTRNFVKNLLTVIVYGSGAKGIASKYVENMLDKAYQLINRLAVEGFPNLSEVERNNILDTFRSINEAMGVTAEVEDGIIVGEKLNNKVWRPLPYTMNQLAAFDAKNFIFHHADIARVTQAVRYFFAEEAMDTAREVMTPQLIDIMHHVGEMTNQMSKVSAFLYKKLYNEFLEDKKKNDPTWVPSDGLTRKEINSIENKVKAILEVPAIGGMPQMTLNKYSRESTKMSTRGMGINEEMRTYDDTFLLDPLGVAGIATTTIKHGDSRVTHSMAKLKGDDYEATGVHDGFNTKLMKAEEYGKDLNRITIEDVTATNVYADIAHFYKKVVDNFGKIGEILTNQEMLELIKTFTDFPDLKAKDAPKALKDNIRYNLSFARFNATQIEATQQTLRKTKINVGHYNGLDGSNYIQDGLEFGSREWLEMAAKEQDKAEKKMSKIFDGKSEDLNVNTNFKKDNSNYATIKVEDNIDKQLARFGMKNEGTDNDKIIIRLSKHPLVKGVQVRVGNMFDMLLDIGKPPSSDNGKILGAMTRVKGRTLILLDRTASKETLAHEMIHAATYQTVTAYMRNGVKGLVGISKERAKAIGKAIDDTVSIMQEFMDDTGKKLKNGEPVTEGELNLYNEVMGHVKAGNASNAVLEFMAWSTNKDVRDSLSKKDFKGSFWANAQRSIKTLIKSILTALGIPGLVIDNNFDRLQFNTLFVAESSKPDFRNDSFIPDFESPTKDLVVLHHAERNSKHPLTSDLERAFAVTLNSMNAAKGRTYSEAIKTSEAKELASKSSLLLSKITQSGIPIDSEDAYLYSMMTSVLAEAIPVKSEVLRQAQELYKQTVKVATVEDFMSDTVDKAQAEKLFNLLKVGSEVKSSNGSSYLVPSFIAMATINRDFSNGLGNISKKGKVVGKGGFDNWVRALGDNLLNTYVDLASNNTKVKSIQEGIDKAVEAFIEYNNRENSVIDRASMVTARAKDWANDKLVSAMDMVGDTMIKAGDSLGDNKVGNITKAVGIILNDKEGKVTKRGLEKIANASMTPSVVREFLTDLTGLTETNAPIYKMIKKIKAHIQRLRQNARVVIPQELAKRFSKMPSKEQWQAMYRNIGKTDISSLLSNYNFNDISNVLSTDKKVQSEIKRIEKEISNATGKNSRKILTKAKELANFMVNGEVSNNQLVNAEQIARLQGEGRTNFKKPSQQDIINIDSLVSLYAFIMLDQTDKNDLRALFTNEKEGLSDLLELHRVINEQELAKETEGTAGRINRRKGWMPFQSTGRSSLIVVEDHLAGELLSKGYTRVGDYKGNPLDTKNKSKGYYFIDTYAKAPYHQGVMQNVKTTINGADDITGFGTNPNGGVITSPKEVKKIHSMMLTGKLNPSKEGLIPIYLNENSSIPYAYERVLDPDKVELLQPNQNLAELIGIQRGRQLEEQVSKATNIVAVNHLLDMYKKAEEDGDTKEYINIFDKDIKDPVILDAVKLIPQHVKQYVEDVNEGILMVPRSMINDTFGYRMAVVGDAWTGNTRFNKQAVTVFREAVQALMGDGAYRKLMKAQFLVQDLVQDARTMIVIKSVVVPTINIIANYVQLVGRGVPLRTMYKETPKIVEEINYYNDMLKELEGLKIDRDIAKEGSKERTKAELQIQSIEDSIKKLSIAPLIEAGEFASVSSAIIDPSLDGLEVGNVDSFVEKAVDKLPEGVRSLGKYAVVSSDTALFQLMQKMTDYGDFVTKAILYKDLVERKKMDKEKALGIITDEFIHYDKLQGRTRHTVENLGLLWFYNWKIRATKIGISMVRNNPFHTLLAASLPIPDLFGNVGLPFEDSILGRALGLGNFSKSIGPGMGIGAPALNPWWNLFN